jgi:hypothetical protein
MKKQISYTAILLALAFQVTAQDSLPPRNQPERPHELGISVLTPLIMLAGASDYQERFSNLTYRYRFTKISAFRAIIGAAPMMNNYGYNSTPYYERPAVVTSNTSTLYPIDEVTTPSNFQVGVGYEYIRGRRLKHCVGIDLVYNNKFEKHKNYFMLRREETDPNGQKVMREYQLDSASTVKAMNFDKIGCNIFFSLRFEATKKFFITASTIATLRYWQSGIAPNKGTTMDMNLVGLIGDVSLFYRFGM